MSRDSFADAVIRSFDEFDAVRDDWNHLADLRENPLWLHAWFACCARAFHKEANLVAPAVWRGGKLVAVAPLARDGVNGRHLELLGFRALYEPGGLLYADVDALRALVRRILDTGLPVAFDRIDEDSPVRRIFRAQHARRALMFQRDAPPSLAVKISSDWTAYTRALSSNLWHGLARLRRRAAQIGSATTEFLAPSPDEIGPLLDIVARIEASGWKGRRGSGMLRNDALGRSFRVYGNLASTRGEIRVVLLRIGRTVAAAEVAVEAYRRLWLLKIAYDDRFSRHYPALLLRFETLARAFSDGLDAVEFLGVAEPWEKRWKTTTRRYALLVAYPLTAQRIRRLAVDAARRAVRMSERREAWRDNRHPEQSRVS